MAIVLSSRKDARKALRDLLANEIPAFVESYDHETKDFGRKSPVGMVHSDGTRTQVPGYADEYHAFIITLLWKRDDGQATEDNIDDLARDVRQLFFDHDQEPGLWDDLRFDEEFSGMDYPLIDNVQYRRERIRVLVHVISEA